METAPSEDKKPFAEEVVESATMRRNRQKKTAADAAKASASASSSSSATDGRLLAVEAGLQQQASMLTTMMDIITRQQGELAELRGENQRLEQLVEDYTTSDPMCDMRKQMEELNWRMTAMEEAIMDESTGSETGNS